MRVADVERVVTVRQVLAVMVGVVLLLGSSGGTATAAPALQDGCPGNLLVNPSFEGGSRKTESEGTSLSSAVSDGWSPWFVRGDEVQNREPEFKVEQVAIGGDPARVRSGGQSMKWFNTWATHTAGLYQRVAAAPGARYEFSAHAMIYTGEADIFDEGRRTWISDRERSGNYRVWVGIDPAGAVPPGMGSEPPASVVWSAASMTPDEWVRPSVSAIARASAVTVYLKGQPEWSVKHNDSFWDDACLVTGGRGPVTDPGAAEAGAAAPVVAEAPDEAAEYPAPAATEAPEAAAALGASGTGGGPEATALPARAAASTAKPVWPRPAVAGERWAIPL